MMSNEMLSKLEAFKDLSDEERQLALDILNQMASDGKSELFDNLRYGDFEEVPVDIDTFLDDPNYLGHDMWIVDEYSGEKKCTLFPYWRNVLHYIFPDNVSTAYNTLILTGCLGYDTPIPLLNGKVEKIGDLAKIENLDEYVYSYDVETNQYVPGHLVKAFSTGIKPVYEITLDNGQKFKATSNHRFMTRDKKWKSIDTGLSVGDSMMPFNTELQSIAGRKGYEVIKNPNKDGTTSDIFTHRLVMNWKIGDYSGVVHHKDYNKLNNDPRNLQLMEWNQHKMFHAKRGGLQWQAFNEKRKLGLIDEELEQKIRAGALLGTKNRWANEDEHKKMSVLTTNRMNNGFAKEMSNVVWNGENAEINKQKVTKNIVTANTDPKRIEQYQISKAIKVGNLAIKDFGEITEESYEQTKIKYNMRTGYPSFKSILNRISLPELTEQAASYNHKIIKIEFIGYEEVYDLTVEKYHNFAIKNGIVAHNSIGLGKTEVASIAMLYLLYRMLCLKDPYSYYGLMPNDKITFSLLNITLDTAKGVGWQKVQQHIQNSPWFMAHGALNASRTNPTWQPDKNIELVFGSSNNQVVGRALFCLDGDTEILTAEGISKIKDLVDKDIQVVSIDDNGKKCLSEHCTVKPTIKTKEEYQIELEDGTVIKCTPNHKLRLIDGSYKEAQYLTENDELMETQCSYFEYIDNIIKTRGQWNEDIKSSHCERHHIIPKCFGGEPKLLDWQQHPNIIWLTPAEHYMAHKLLALENPADHRLITAFKRMCYDKNHNFIGTAEDYEFIRINWGKSHSKLLTGVKYTEEQKQAWKFSEERKQEYSKKFSGKNNPMYGKGYKLVGEKNGCYGHPVEPERLAKIKQTRTKYIYSYDNKDFYGWYDLQVYLRSIGYNKISQKGIESCIIGTPATKIKYPELCLKITKRLKEDAK